MPVTASWIYLIAFFKSPESFCEVRRHCKKDRENAPIFQIICCSQRSLKHLIDWEPYPLPFDAFGVSKKGVSLHCTKG